MIFMLQEFGDVLRELMPMIMDLYAGKKPTVAESTDDDGTVGQFIVLWCFMMLYKVQDVTSYAILQISASLNTNYNFLTIFTVSFWL